MSQQESTITIFQLRDVIFDHAAQTRQLDGACPNLIPVVIAEADKYKHTAKGDDDQDGGSGTGKNQMR